jgi:quercetin dioxygenase-like cupin family protein
MCRTEVITRGNAPAVEEPAPGVQLRVFVSGAAGARGLSTGMATLRPRARLPVHAHPASFAVVLLRGEANLFVEERGYRLKAHDAVHLPAGVAHRLDNASPDRPAVLFWALASPTPAWEVVSGRSAAIDGADSRGQVPEHLIRFDHAPVYELAPRAFFRDLFARRFGSRGICGGYGLFQPGASLPCHCHGFDESITIVAGRAVCQVAGREYELSDYDTACVPQGRPHRFLNRSDEPMAMIWVYAGDEPDRTILDQGYCEGILPPSPPSSAGSS